MMKPIKKAIIIGSTVLISSSYATTVDLEAFIKNSGIQPVNTTEQKVNDNLICPYGNDNSNTYAGCDMDHDYQNFN